MMGGLSPEVSFMKLQYRHLNGAYEYCRMLISKKKINAPFAWYDLILPTTNITCHHCHAVCIIEVKCGRILLSDLSVREGLLC